MRFIVFSLLFMLSCKLEALHHEYELSRGRKMWMGFQRVVHYFDHFSLLTQRLKNIKGLITTNYPLLYQQEWSLTFDLKKFGQSKSEDDGFMLLLSPQDINAFEGDESSNQRKSFLSMGVS